MNKTGNIAVDMVTACLAHNKRGTRKIKSISLIPKYWGMFLKHAEKLHPEVEIENEIVFKNVTLKKGSAFMVENLAVEYQKD